MDFFYFVTQRRDKLVMYLVFLNLFTHKARGVLKILSKSVCVVQIELECGSADFCGEGKLEYPEKNLSEQRRE